MSAESRINNIMKMMEKQNEKLAKMIEARDSGKICCYMCDCYNGVECLKGYIINDPMEPMDDCPGFEED